MKIALDMRKSLEKNAERYFQKAKKARKKLQGAKKALETTKIKVEMAQDSPVEKPVPLQERARKTEWFEKFHWFISSDGFLAIGGRDASTNELVIKKYAEPADIVFHTDMAGSPFVVVKSEGKSIPDSTLQEAADFTLAHSKAWKKGLLTAAVFHVTPNQVSKEARAGEYLPKGAFMIYGETNYVDTKMNFSIGLCVHEKAEGKLMGGPVSAVKENCKKFVEVVQGRRKTSDVAKQAKAFLGKGELDDIIRILPAGGSEIKQ